MDQGSSPAQRRPYRLVVTIALSAALLTLSITGLVVHIHNGKIWSKRALHGEIALNQNQLENLIKTNNLTVFWAGPRVGYLYSLNLLSADRLMLNYVAAKASPKDVVANSRVIATYKSPHAFANTVAAAALVGNTGFRNSDGSVVFYQTNRKTDVYLGIPKENYQIEIYDPIVGQALSLAILQGQITKVGQ